MAIAVLVVASVVCAALQRVIGVGYSLILLPASIAALPDAQAVPCVLAAGMVLSVGLLLCPPQLPRPEDVTRGLVASAPLGQLLALLALGALRGSGLRIAAACALLAGCVAAVAQGRLKVRGPGAKAGAAAGLAIGAAGALTGIMGPFVALLLTLRADAGGDALRRQLWLCTAWLSSTALTLSAALGVGDLHGVVIGLALAPALLGGALVAAPLAGRLTPRQHRLVVLALAASGGAALLAGA